MLARWWGVGAALWTLGFVLLYVAVVRHQGSDVAWWYVALLWAASALAASADLLPSPRRALTVATALYAVCTVLGLLTIGALLVPALVASVLAARAAGARSARRTRGREVDPV